jgi:CcmD family protein
MVGRGCGTSRRPGPGGSRSTRPGAERMSLEPIGDVVFVVSAYVVIFTGVAVYAATLVRRLRRAERAAAAPEEPAEPTR